MKNFLLIGLFAAVLGMSCKKDEDASSRIFDQITFDDIQKNQEQFSAQSIVFSNEANGRLIKNGAILFFKLNTNYYGKLRIVGLDENHTLTFDMVTYDTNGNTVLTKRIVLENLKSDVDLDTGTIKDHVDETIDLIWDVQPTENTLLPIGTKLYMYSN